MEEDTSLPIHRISTVARETGRSQVTIRALEKDGITPKIRRDRAGHRRYSRDELEIIKEIFMDREDK